MKVPVTTYLPDTVPYDELTCAFHGAEDPTTVLSRLVDRLAADVPQADAVTLTLSPIGRHPRHLAASSAVGLAADQAQLRCQEGPLLAAVECEGAVVSDDLRSDARWPRMAAHLARHTSMRSAWVMRLCSNANVALSFYAAASGAFDAEISAAARRAASFAHPVIDHYHSVNRATNLATALETSRQIGAAMGVLMATRKITDRQAFELLRATSQQLHRKLRDIAVEVTETGVLPTHSPVAARANGHRSRH
jgi:hypothetical protein